MQVVYARKNLSSRQEIYTAGGAIFLAGPTPRNIHVDSWRSEALGLLDDAGFSGYVFVPEDIRGGMRGDKRRQREWEWSAIEAADTVLFWVPRNLVDMPAFTTNIEFGYLAGRSPCKVVLGVPDGTPKTGYMLAFCEREDVMIPTCTTLFRTVLLAAALTRIAISKKAE